MAWGGDGGILRFFQCNSIGKLGAWPEYFMDIRTRTGDSSSGMFYYTSDLDTPLVARKMEITDNVIPASNSEMAKNVLMLGHYYYEEGYIGMATTMLSNVRERALAGGAYYANWDILMGWIAAAPVEVVIIGEGYASILKALQRHYLPHVFFSGGEDEGDLPLLAGKKKKGQTIIYVCRNKTCERGVTSAEEALALIRRL